MDGGAAPVIVKLGGSFAGSVHLRAWVGALASCAGRVVIVPGGGPFANAVREAQSWMRFDDEVAHHLAIVAMEQFGRAVASLDAALSPADSAEAIRRDLAAGRVPVWMPTSMVLGAADIAPSWDTTSDSLAAWLAGRIGAERLLLVKHLDAQRVPVRAEELTVQGMVDASFAQHARASAIPVFVLGPTDHDGVASAIRHGYPTGAAVA